MAVDGNNSVRHGISLGLGLLFFLHFLVCVQARCFPWPWNTACKLQEAEEARTKAVLAEEKRYQDFRKDLRDLETAEKHNENSFKFNEYRRILKPLLPFRPNLQHGASSLGLVKNFELDSKSLARKMENYLENTTGNFSHYFEAKLERLGFQLEDKLNRYYNYMKM